MTNEEAIAILEMFLHKQCSLSRTEFAYTQREVWRAVGMATEALKLKNPDDSLLMADSGERKERKSKLGLISRQDALDAVAEWMLEVVVRGEVKEGVLERLRKIPPKTIAGSLISRQAVIREIDEWIQLGSESDDDMVITEFLSLLKERINVLTATEPQYAGCGGCVHYEQQQTALICHDCRRYYKDLYEDGEKHEQSD